MSRQLICLAFALAAATIVAAAQPPTTTGAVEKLIAEAHKRVENSPKSPQAWNDYGATLCRKGRDWEDVRLYKEAEQATRRARELAPGNTQVAFEADKIEATALLGLRNYPDALQLAKQLNHKIPDDIATWALLVDSYVALGNYSEAERCAQWILDLRPGNTLGFVKAAGLRELFGDVEGAIEFLEEARRRTSRNDLEELAWLLGENARLQVEIGNLAAAEQALQQAAQFNPNSQSQLKLKARIRTANGEYAEAARLFEQRYRDVGSPASLYDWAEALSRAGHEQEARETFETFEARARPLMLKPGNADLQLIAYYSDRANKHEEALRLASERVKSQADVASLDAYAWSLFYQGKQADAYAQIQRALGIGVRNPVYFCHATHIAKSSGHSPEAERYAKAVTEHGYAGCATTPLPSLAVAVK